MTQEALARFPISDAVTSFGEIERLSLAYHIAELEVEGYKVVPPGKVRPPESKHHMLDAALRVMEKRTGLKLTPGYEGGKC